MSKINYVTRKLSQIAKITTGSTPSTSDGTNFSDKGVCWVKPDNLRGLNGVSQVKQKISAKGMLSMSMVRKGSVLVNCIGDVGKIGVADIDLVTNQQINSISFNNSLVDDRYGAYMILASEDEAKSEANSVVVPILNKGNQSNIKYTFPESVELQKSIATYLDRKVSIIDKIITAKNHTHTHLLELRQAIITDAVLGRGSVFMNYRQTNIPWIGKIPAHWQVRKIKDIADISVGWTPDTNNPDYFNGNNTWVTIADMNQKYIVSSKVKISNEAINSSRIKLVKKGSLLYSFKLSVGKVAFAGKDLYTNEAIAAITPNYNDEVDTSFLYYAISTYLANNANENIYGAKIMNQDTIRNSYIAFPDINEQLKISRTLDKNVRNIDDAMSINKQSIQLLNEYRSSLISNVINGKVKV